MKEIEALSRECASSLIARRRALDRAWRRERDSNPRAPFGANGFQDRRFQPLTHPSARNLAILEGDATGDSLTRLPHFPASSFISLQSALIAIYFRLPYCRRFLMRRFVLGAFACLMVVWLMAHVVSPVQVAARPAAAAAADSPAPLDGFSADSTRC